MLMDPNHPDPQPWNRRGRNSPRSAVNLTGQYGKEAGAAKLNTKKDQDEEQAGAAKL